MKVAILHGSSDLYGASRVLVSEVEALVGLGHEVNVVLPYEGPLEEVLHLAGAVVSVDPRLIVLRVSRWRDLAHVPRLPLGAEKSDVIVLWTLALCAYAPYLTARGLRFYVSVHELRPNPLAGLIVRFLLAFGNFPVQAISGAVLEWLCENGVRRSRVRVVYPVVRYPHNSPRPVGGDFTIAVVGRVNGRKGHVEVVRAFKRASNGSSEWQLVLAGSPFAGQEQHVRELLDEIGGDLRIHFVGEIHGTTDISPTPHLVACFGDRPEAFGLVPLEASTIGVRAASFDEGGPAEILPLLGGLLQPRGSDSVSAIVEALRRAHEELHEWNPPPLEPLRNLFSPESRKIGAQKVLGLLTQGEERSS